MTVNNIKDLIKPLVIYHANCMDGTASAWAAWNSMAWHGAEFLPAIYDSPPPDVQGRDVLIVDFSYPRNTLIDMASKAKSLKVLDHHKTAQADLEGLPFCVFDMNRSGAGLTWDTLFSGLSRHWLIDYIEDRDLWKFNLPDSVDVNAYIQTLGFSIDAMERLDSEGRDAAKAKGAVATAMIKNYVALTKQAARHYWLNGKEPIPGVNAPAWSVSELVGALAKDTPLFAFAWSQLSSGKYVYSLRSRPDGSDVSVVAKDFGGGGHKHAAGFVVDRLVHVDFVQKESSKQ